MIYFSDFCLLVIYSLFSRDFELFTHFRTPTAEELSLKCHRARNHKGAEMKELVSGEGIEPPSIGSKPIVLPLDEPEYGKDSFHLSFDIAF